TCIRTEQCLDFRRVCFRSSGGIFMELSPMEVIFLFLGGLGIFLYGIKMMGDGLQAAAGDRLREILNRMTSNPLLGVLAGIIVTEHGTASCSGSEMNTVRTN